MRRLIGPAATLDTVHEGKFNDEYAWREVQHIHADIFVPTGIVQAEDIRWQWITYEKVKQFYQDHKVSKLVFISSHMLYHSTNNVLPSSLSSFYSSKYGFHLVREGDP